MLTRMPFFVGVAFLFLLLAIKGFMWLTTGSFPIEAVVSSIHSEDLFFAVPKTETNEETRAVTIGVIPKPLSATPKPLPTVLIKVEWPREIEINTLDTVTVSLIKIADEEFVPITDVENHKVVVVTPLPIPGSTPEAPMISAFGPEYQGYVIAKLVGEPSFEILPVIEERQSLDQSKINWVWNVRPNRTGPQVLDVNITAHWEHKNRDGRNIEYTILRSRSDVVVKELSPGPPSFIWVAGAALLTVVALSGLAQLTGYSLKSILGRSPPPINLLISIGYPKYLSKRYASPFKVTLYPSQKREEAQNRLKRGFEESIIEELNQNTGLTPGLTVVIKFISQDIEFGDETVKKLEDKINTTTLTGKPKDDCHPGNHTVKLSITDKLTGHEYVSHTFDVKVVDFAFDHVSRPFLLNALSGILGLAAVATYTFTFFEQVDTTYGLTAGTAGGAAAGYIYARYQILYKLFNRTSNVITNRP